MFNFFTGSSRPGRRHRLSASYAELRNVDEALREAESRLEAAHQQFAQRQGPRPDSLYREVLRLRDRSRQLLGELGDLFVAEDSRFV